MEPLHVAQQARPTERGRLNCRIDLLRADCWQTERLPSDEQRVENALNKLFFPTSDVHKHDFCLWMA